MTPSAALRAPAPSGRELLTKPERFTYAESFSVLPKAPSLRELAKPSGFAREGSANRGYPFGPLCENEFVAAHRPRQTQKYKIHSADNGRAKRSHFSIVSSFCKLKFPKYAIYACKILFLRCKYCILVSFTAGFACQNAFKRESIAFQFNQERGIL